jgi:hypothetical protein
MAWFVPSANEGLAGVTARETSTGCPTLSVAVAVIDPELAAMVALPTPVPVAIPVLATVAVLFEEELQLTPLVTFCVLPSLYVPVAVNCWLVPFAIDALDGAIDREVSTGAVTVIVAELPIVPDLAVIVAVPWAKLVANPLALTVAMEVADEVQAATPVRFCVLPLLYVPVAVNCSV